MYSKTTIHGYLGRDPELKSYKKKDGTSGALANFTVGVSRDIGDETDWFNCTIFGKRAEVIEKYFKKGSQILLSGRMESSKYEKDGKTMTSWKLMVDDFDFCDKKGGSGKSDDLGWAKSKDSFEEVEEEIPF